MPKRILLVEDDQYQRQAEEAVLRLRGFDVAIAVDGEDAMKRLAGPERPDVIVLDLIMPKLSGFEVLKRVKSDPETRAIPVIVLSNLSQESDRRQVLESGAAEYLVKANLTLQGVVERIEAVLTEGGRA
jgi:two-component system, OmpR family, phosphate regulon response regulator PhoB